LGTRCFAELEPSERDEEVPAFLKAGECPKSPGEGFREIPCEEIPSECFSSGDAASNSVIIKKRFIVLKEGRCIYVPRGVYLKALIIEYSRVWALVSEGDYVKKWAEVAAAVSKKGIYRKVKSPVEGLLVLVHQDFSSKADRYTLYIDTNNKVKVLFKNEPGGRFGEDNTQARTH